MRVMGIVAVTWMLSACSFLDQLAVNGGYRLDPNKIYLGTSRVSLRAAEVDAYACVGAPLVCVRRGISLDCGCPY